MSQFFRGKHVKKTRKKGRDFLYLATGAVLLVLPMLVIAAKRSALVNVGYQITELRQENVKLNEEQVRLRAELTTLTRPDRIWQQALDMGLRPMEEGRHLEVQVLESLDNVPQAEALLATAREP